MPVQVYSQSNPLCQFLTKAKSYFGAASSLAAIRTNIARMEEFVNNVEQRRYYGDLVDRVEQIAFAFDRLFELAEQMRAAQRQFDAISHQARAKGLSNWEIPDEIVISRERTHAEAAILTAYIYHEVATLFSMTLRPEHSLLKRPAEGSELKYLLGVRNKLLVHPEVGAVVKSSRSQLTVGDYLRTDLVGLESGYAPLVRDYHAQACGSAADFFDNDEVEANKKLLQSHKKVEKLTMNEKHRLKAFSIREPDLKKCLLELDQLLVEQVLPEIKTVTQWTVQGLSAR